MTNVEKLKSKCEQIEQEICDAYIDVNGKAEPIVDGIVDIDKYLETEPKILWILKEPYDDVEDGLASGGGWHFSNDFLANDDFYKGMGRSRATWHPVIYVSFGILNSFRDYNDMDYIRDDQTMVDVIKQIAVINVKKLPGFTRTYGSVTINSAYLEHKELLHKQIELYNPDIIIGGSTMYLFYEKLRINPEDIIKSGSIDYAIKGNKIYIAAYHPGQTQVTRDVYVNDIIKATQAFWETRKI